MVGAWDGESGGNRKGVGDRKAQGDGARVAQMAGQGQRA